MKKYVKLFEEHIEGGHPGFLQSEEEIHDWLREYDRQYHQNIYTINDDWSVDVDGDVNIDYNKLNYILVEFNYVSGHFWCNNNLTSLEGAPQKVGGSFYCDNNDLTSLEGAPQKVDGNFWCNNNDLTTLEGAPQKVGRVFDCSDNDLTSLEGAPQKVDGWFDCTGNKDLVTLAHKSNIQGKFVHDELQGTIEERIERYINYLDTLDMEEKRSSIDWLGSVDSHFFKEMVMYLKKNNMDIEGVDLSLSKRVATERNKRMGLW